MLVTIIKAGKFLILTFSIFIFGCSGGGSSSGSNADIDTVDIAGIYNGEEVLTLVPENGSEAANEITNTVRISISSNGVLSFTSSSGSSGTAQINNDQQFELRADARTAFDGACSSGTIYLNGQIASNSIKGSYRSERLICQDEPYNLTGSLEATR